MIPKAVKPLHPTNRLHNLSPPNRRSRAGDMSSAVEGDVAKPEEAEKPAGGELLFCGGTDWDGIGRRKGGAVQGENLVLPTRLRTLVNVDIRFVASGCVSCHCVALDVEGRCYTWGRNEKGQLGHGDTLQRDRPTMVSGLSKYKIIGAGAGRSHSVVVTDDGNSFSFGWNKHGQLGSGTARNEVELSPVRCLVSDVTTAACGADFTVWLSSVEGSSILTAGLPQYGQLGHGTDNEYNVKDSSVRLVYEAQPRPRAIASLSQTTIVKVACGTNHTVAVDSKGLVYTWGFGGHGRLGHREQKDEWAPRLVDIFQRNNTLPPNAVISAGASNSACTAGGGQLYMWGKLKNTGDDWMYPKPLLDLSGWNIRCMDSGMMFHFVGADSSCISWGHAQYGELGYGSGQQKSSANPKKVDTLEGVHVISVACGMGHSLIVVERASISDRLDQIAVHDGKTEPAGEKYSFDMRIHAGGNGVKGETPNSKKRKKSSASEGESGDESDSIGDLNGGSKTKGQRGRGRGRPKADTKQKSSGRGRGRPKAEEAPPSQGRGKTAKRGRPSKR